MFVSVETRARLWSCSPNVVRTGCGHLPWIRFMEFFMWKVHQKECLNSWGAIHRLSSCHPLFDNQEQHISCLKNSAKVNTKPEHETCDYQGSEQGMRRKRRKPMSHFVRCLSKCLGQCTPCLRCLTRLTHAFGVSFSAGSQDAGNGSIMRGLEQSNGIGMLAGNLLVGVSIWTRPSIIHIRLDDCAKHVPLAPFRHVWTRVNLSKNCLLNDDCDLLKSTTTNFRKPFWGTWYRITMNHKFQG